MELCEESLTAFLERSPGPLPYQIEVNICYDIALGLVYLHSNGVIHRDLTGNNVLMVAGPRAKITDFGMSKLARSNTCMTALTLCPGNLLYMSPEALDEAKSYTAKLDIFSFGVIVIQILTRQFPNPTDRFHTIPSTYNKEEDEESDEEERREIRQVIPETERRQAHLNLIVNSHPLKPVVLLCLKKEKHRPSALQLSESLSELKQSPEYTKTQVSADTQQLQWQLQNQIAVIEAKDMELHAKNRQLQLEVSARERKERELQQVQEQLHYQQQLVLDLQQSISAHLQQPDVQKTRGQPSQQELPVTTAQTAVALVQKDIGKMTWRKGKNAPEAMARGGVVVHHNTVYIMPEDSCKVYSYQHVLGEEKWSRLPDNPLSNCGLAVIDGLLTSIGGWDVFFACKSLLCLCKDGEKKQWSEIFPSMTTPRSSSACVTTEQALVVSGGFTEVFSTAVVEVMNLDTKQWATACPLPIECSSFTATVYKDNLYLAGGYIKAMFSQPSKLVFAISLSDLFPSTTLGCEPQTTLASSCSVWREIGNLPLILTTLVSYAGELLAVGGTDDSRDPTADVHRYDPHTNSWTSIARMKTKRSLCLAFVLPENGLIVVGRNTDMFHPDNGGSVEILE